MPNEIKSARDALEKCYEIALQWEADELAGVAGTTDKPEARSASEALLEIERLCKSALALPRRNCDMGTPDEQVERWNNENPYPYEWDDRQYLDAREVLGWAQMPYEETEGGAK